ncbi:hypothetical protein C8Q72DRAFT_793104 [Fomitopsis betulina]|nr:hypothetical protein C8Q72DRAFT_793104 [Fomitopsis betulina]
MFLNHLDVSFIHIPLGQGAITLGEHDFKHYGNVASCRVEYDIRLLDVRIVCSNKAGDNFCAFLSVKGHAATRPTYIPVAASGALVSIPTSAKTEAPADARTQARPTVYEVRVFNYSVIQHFPARSVPDEEGSPPTNTADHEYCAPIPDQWIRPYALFRFACAQRGTLVPLYELQGMSARSTPSLPPLSAMSIDLPMSMELTDSNNPRES